MTDFPHTTEPQAPLGFNFELVPVVALPPPGAGRTRAVVKTFEAFKAFVSGVSGPSAIGRAHALAATRTALDSTPAKPRKPSKPRRPPLDSLLKQAAKAGKSVKGAEVYQDRTVLQFGDPTPVEPENPWPLDEFRTKETKQ